MNRVGRALLTWTLLSGLAACRAAIPEVQLDFDAGSMPPSAPASKSSKALRFSIAAIHSPAGTYVGYTRLLRQIGEAMGGEVELVHRRTYRETTDLLIGGQIDAAFVCTGGYADLLERRAPAELLVVPVVRGLMTYRSLIIVRADSAIARFEELEEKRFAFTDELSLSGHAWPLAHARSLGLDPRRFFSARYFTQSHDRSIEAVANGFVSGAAVDSNIYADLVARRPELGARVRVLQASPTYGIPPVVVSTAMSAEQRARFRAVLVSLAADPASAAVLQELGIDRFEVAPIGLYDSAIALLGAAQ